MSTMFKPSTYVCVACEEEFERVRSDEEAMAEAQLLWGINQNDDHDIVCETCFQAVIQWHGMQIGRA